MWHEARALHELHLLLHRAEDLGISRAVRMKLVGIIGELEAEELERFRAKFGGEDSRMQARPEERAREWEPQTD